MDDRGKTRIETDSFGPVEVPAEHYWGAQTQRRDVPVIVEIGGAALLALSL
jgi:fumarate hydratase class II